MAVKCFYCRSAPNLSKGECQKSCESNHNWGNYGQKEITYFQEAFPQVPPLTWTTLDRKRPNEDPILIINKILK